MDRRADVDGAHDLEVERAIDDERKSIIITIHVFELFTAGGGTAGGAAAPASAPGLVTVGARVADEAVSSGTGEN